MALIPVRAIIELAGAAALIPVMLLVFDRETLESSFLSRLDFLPETELMWGVIAAVLGILLVKFLLSMFLVRFQQKYLLSLYRHFSGTLFDRLYHSGLLFLKNGNPSEMTFNINAVCYAYVVSYLAGIMSIIGQSVLALLVIAALLVYSWKAAMLAVMSFIPAVGAYLLFVRGPLRRYGSLENEARRKQYRLVMETLRGYSEVEVNNAFPSVRERFGRGLDEISRNQVKTGILQSMPSYLLEIVAVVVIAVMLVLMAGRPDGMLFMSVFSVAMLRLLPTVKSLISSWSTVKSTRFTRDVVEQMDKYTPYRDDCTDEPMEFKDRIRVQNLTFSFPDSSESDVIKDLTFQINKGERIGIRGRTGAGKTTLFNLLLGLYPPTSGSISIDGVTLDRTNIGRWHRLAGYVPQDVFISDQTILENVALGTEPGKIDRKRVEEAVRKASLSEFVNSLPDGLDTRIGDGGSRISGGQRQRIGIARALYKQAQVLFFDEATSSLDSKTESEVNAAIDSLSTFDSSLTVICISHRDSTLAFCDRIIEI